MDNAFFDGGNSFEKKKMEFFTTVKITESAKQRVKTDIDLARKLKLNGTPSLLLCCPDGSVYVVKSLSAVEEMLK